MSKRKAWNYYQSKVGRNCGRIEQRGEGDSAHLDGIVATRYGFVRVYSTEGFTSLRFIYNGVERGAIIGREFTRIGLATVAGRFAFDVAMGRVKRGAA
jgi:hypothetical protein